MFAQSRLDVFCRSCAGSYNWVTSTFMTRSDDHYQCKTGTMIMHDYDFFLQYIFSWLYVRRRYRCKTPGWGRGRGSDGAKIGTELSEILQIIYDGALLTKGLLCEDWSNCDVSVVTVIAYY